MNRLQLLLRLHGMCKYKSYRLLLGKKSEAGLFSALFIAIVPSYLSRSVAGSYDNEGVSIFALVFCFYLFVKSVNTVNYFITL